MSAHTKTKQALTYLRQAGNKGIHSLHLNALLVSNRSAARVQDLKDQGYQITATPERMGHAWGVRYVLVGSPEEEKKPEYRFDAGRQVFVYG